jgi:adenylate cyclase
LNLSRAVEKRNIILNLYNSGIDPEVISLELDLSQDVVMDVIEKEINKKHKESASSRSNVLLNKIYLDAVIDVESMVKDSQVRTWNALKAKPDFDISIRDTQNILEKYIESKANLVILHIDLVGSTRMSLTLPIDRLTTIIRSFAQQMSLMVSMYGGYVLKYIGDAVLAFFVVDEGDVSGGMSYGDSEDDEPKDNNGFKSLQYTNAISCAYTMIKVIQQGINPILDQYDYPELKVRVGIDLGEVAVVQYGMDVDEYEKMVVKRPHIDLVGYTISTAVKMTSVANPDSIVIGKKLFEKLDDRHRDLFKKLPENSDIWDYTSEATGKMYDLYKSNI